MRLDYYLLQSGVAKVFMKCFFNVNFYWHQANYSKYINCKFMIWWTCRELIDLYNQCSDHYFHPRESSGRNSCQLSAPFPSTSSHSLASNTIAYFCLFEFHANRVVQYFFCAGLVLSNTARFLCVVCSYSWLYSMPLCEHSTIHSSTLQLMDI